MRFFLQCENNRENFLGIDRKTFIAYPNMCHFVIVKIGGGCKRLATHLALVGLLPGVDPPVRVQAGAGAEPFVANVAHMRPLSGVGADVSLQEAGTVELLATRVAGQHGLGPPRDWQRLELVVAAVHQLGLGLGHVLATKWRLSWSDRVEIS